MKGNGWVGAIANGVSKEELKELFLQAAIYCGVPAANTAFHLAAEVFSELDAQTEQQD